MADVRAFGAHDIIGDRAFGTTAEQVSALARAMAQGLLDSGVLPVLKHIPGHGRAASDSHEELPVIDANLAELSASDFIPFKALGDLPFAMTAHVRYTALDPERPATLSPAVLRFIRETLGFKGVLMSDDLSMKALCGDFVSRTRDSLAAGCDVVLHCNGEMAEMIAIASVVESLSPSAMERTLRAGMMLRPPVAFDRTEALNTLETLHVA
jgi:beta-N-acetylhexosaminidase